MRTVSAQYYYDFSPTVGNAPGDIWSDLPTHGMLGSQSLPGIVIAPACDLSQGKVETITYLPIVPLRAYFSLPGALPEIRRAIEGQFAFLALDGVMNWPAQYIAPDLSTIDAAVDLLNQYSNSPKISKKEVVCVKRCEAGLRLLRNFQRPELVEADPKDLNALLGDKEWLNYRSRLVRNALRSDLHFLPADGQLASWSGVPCHSLVLFRYPLTAPIDVFECAQDISLVDWKNCCEQLGVIVPLVMAFAARRPIKRLTLKPDFLADLLTRYVSLYVRLGSPDFSEHTINQFCTEVHNVG